MRCHPECDKQSKESTWNRTDLQAQPPLLTYMTY